MKEGYVSYEQAFFIDGLQVSGVQSIQGGYFITEAPVNVLGFGNVGESFFEASPNQGQAAPPSNMAALVSPIEGRFEIESTLASSDLYLNYTGGQPFSGGVVYSDKSFGFNSGYISQHQVSCQVGQLPSTSTSILSFGDVGSGINPKEASFPHANPGPVAFTNQENIRVTCRGSSTNRVVAASYRLSTQLDPIYVLGNTFAHQVDVVWPMIGEMAFSIETDDYEYKAMRDYFVKPELSDISMEIFDCDQNLIQKYEIISGRLVTESISTSVNNLISVDLSYKTFYNKR